MKAMKRILLFVGLAVAALSFVGCNKQESEPAVKDSQVSIRLVTPETKTVSSDWSTFWAEGDALSVFYTPAGRRDYSDNIKFEVTSPDDGIAKADVTLDDGTYDWYAFYPYNEYFPSPANNNSDPARTYIGGRSDRAQVQEGYSNLDHVAGPNVPLYGIVTGVSSTTDPEILMKHVASLAEILVTNNSGEPVTITGIELSAPEDVDIVGYYNITFDDEPTFTKYMDYQSNTAKLTVTDGQPLRNSAYAKFYLVVKPFEADELTVKVITDAGSQEKTATIPSTAVFTSGHIKTLNFSFDGPDAVVNKYTVSEVVEADDDTEVCMADAIVAARSTKGFIATDGTNNIYVYLNAEPEVAIGDEVTVNGTKTTYYGLPEVKDVTSVVKTDSDQTVPYTTLVELTKDNIDDYNSSTADYISVTGKLEKSGNYYNVRLTGAERYASADYLISSIDPSDLVGKTVTMTGYFNTIHSTRNYVKVVVTEFEEVAGAETETTLSIPYNASVYVGETFDLNATTNVDATITYESEDETIASVDSDGVITGVAEGTVKVYARIAGVAGQYTSAEKYCNVTVSIKPQETDGTVIFDQEFLAANQNGTKDVISYTNSSDYGSTVVTELRIYKNQTLTISASDGKTITSIKMTCSGSGTNNYGPGKWGEGAPSGYTYEGTVGTWTGSETSVTFTAKDAQVRIRNLVVTYE